MVTPAPGLSWETILEAPVWAKVDGRQIIGIPPLEIAAPLSKSTFQHQSAKLTCPPTPESILDPTESAQT